jgi:hypothetical protein
VLDALSTDSLRCTSIGNASVHGSSTAVGCYKYLVLTKVHGLGRGGAQVARLADSYWSANITFEGSLLSG